MFKVVTAAWDGAIKRVRVGKGLVGEMMGFEIVPDNRIWASPQV
jgi:hypothetical protein